MPELPQRQLLRHHRVDRSFGLVCHRPIRFCWCNHVQLLPCGELLRHDWPIDSDGCVPGRIVRRSGCVGVQRLQRRLLLRNVRSDVLELSDGRGLGGRCRDLHVVRFGPLPTVHGSEHLCLVPGGELLLGDGSVGGDGCMRGGIVCGGGCGAVLQLRRGPVLRCPWSGLGLGFLRRGRLLRCRSGRLLELCGRHVFGGRFGRLFELRVGLGPSQHRSVQLFELRSRHIPSRSGSDGVCGMLRGHQLGEHRSDAVVGVQRVRRRDVLGFVGQRLLELRGGNFRWRCGC